MQSIPAIPEMYDKECQTDAIDDFISEDAEDVGDVRSPPPSSKLQHRRPQSVRKGHASGSEDGRSSHGAAQTPADARIGPSAAPVTTADLGEITPKKILTDEEKRDIMKSHHFSDFLSRSSYVIDRALGQQSVFDMLRDYKSDTVSGYRGDSEARILSFNALYEVDAVKGRPVMDLQFSPHFPELFLVAYGSKAAATSRMKSPKSSYAKSMKFTSTTSGTDESLGLVCVWSIGCTITCEFIFTASSPVLCARFHDTDPHLILGGCYTGQILLWDTRAKSSSVQRSALTGKGHKHPVYSMVLVESRSTKSVGSSNVAKEDEASSELITVSSDGTVCHWDIGGLAEPTHNISLQSLLGGAGMGGGIGSGKESMLPLNISSMAHGDTGDGSDGDAKDVVFGSGVGSVYRSFLPLRPNQPVQQSEIHGGLITAMKWNPSGRRNFKHLLLTCSLDWTVKLWNLKSSAKSLPTSPMKAASSSSLSSRQVAALHSDALQKPLFEFYTPTYEYACDAQWSPTNPGAP
jgi:dynein intermediate chain